MIFSGLKEELAGKPSRTFGKYFKNAETEKNL